MAKKTEKRGLGRGLSALMADIDAPARDTGANATEKTSRGEQFVDITRVHPNPDQPRRSFDDADLRDLAKSVLEKGIIQPLIVRANPQDANSFQIVAGERRWRAAQIAKLDQVPVLVRSFDDLEVLEIAIIENIQRADLNPVDEASGYQQLMEKFGHTQDKMAIALGKSRSYIANSLRLLNLPDDVLELLRDGRLSAGHARALVPAPNASALARRIVADGLSVRQTEALAKRGDTPTKTAKSPSAGKDSDTISLEADLTANLGMKVAINHKAGAESGALTISYKSLEELDELCQILSATRRAGSK